VTHAGLDTIELIDGVIYDVSPESVVHLRAVEAIYHRLINPVPGGVLQRFTEPEGVAYRQMESTPLPDGLRSLDH
jgi:hypothetical protein